MRIQLYLPGLALAVACASGGADIDAASIDATVADARVDAAAPDAPGDGPVIDAAIDAAIDARVDAPAIDARIDAPIDAPPIDAPIDAPPIDGPPLVVAGLLLSEASLAPTVGEFIEIVNPTASAVDLSTYYLTDAPSYHRLPAGVIAAAVDSADFIVKFPAGASIPAGGVVTVALDTAANFTTTYPGVTPTYSIASATMVSIASSAGSTLTNAGEPIVLFAWDGGTDKVTDVDIMIVGTPSTTNALVNKSSVAIDGPDPDTATSTYAVDASTLPSQTAPGSARSTKRIALESAAVETQVGTGNGINGHDETSEMLGITWDTTAYSVPTPGAVPPALLP